MVSRLDKKLSEEIRKQKIVDLTAQGKSRLEIAQELKTTRQEVTRVLEEQYANASTPEQIMELRDKQGELLQTHTPHLASRFIKQNQVTERLLKKYEKYIEEDEEGKNTYTHFYDTAILEGSAPEEAHKIAVLEVANYRNSRDQISKEVERSAKISDSYYRVFAEQQNRIAKLFGLDSPQRTEHTLHRTDEIKLTLEQEIKAEQKKLQESVIEAEVVEEGEL